MVSARRLVRISGIVCRPIERPCSVHGCQKLSQPDGVQLLPKTSNLYFVGPIVKVAKAVVHDETVLEYLAILLIALVHEILSPYVAGRLHMQSNIIRSLTEIQRIYIPKE